ncbi:MAG: hypothetical protein R3F11_25800 [Verrucomicrobiales bacterium]
MSKKPAAAVFTWMLEGLKVAIAYWLASALPSLIGWFVFRVLATVADRLIGEGTAGAMAVKVGCGAGLALLGLALFGRIFAGIYGDRSWRRAAG